MSIDQAVVPAAGYGTRLRPLTVAIPKEMLPLGRKPVLEHVVDELKSAGIRRVLFVVSPGKEIIRSYFQDGSRWGVKCEYVVQPDMKGLGDAILLSERWMGGSPALIAFGDCVIESTCDTPVSRLIKAHLEAGAGATVLTQRIPRESTRKYGIMKPAAKADLDFPFPLEDIVEKPLPENAPSDLAVAGRWILGPSVLELLTRTSAGSDGELSLTDAIRLGIKERLSVWATPLRDGESRRDIGGWETYLSAVADYAVRDSEFGDSVRAKLCGSR